MDGAKNGYQATPNAALEQQVDTCPTCGSECNERDELEKAEREIERLRAAPVQQAAPVGYFVNDESDDQWHQVDYEQRNGADTYPLYLHPPADEVRRLRDALDEIESETQDVSIQQIARKALEGK